MNLKLALVSAFPPGGRSLSEYGFHLARALAECDEVGEVIVLADRLDDPLPELNLGSKIKVRRVWRFNSLRVVPSILGALRAECVDGVLYNLQTATFGDRDIPAALGLFSPLSSRFFGIPSGVVAHNLITKMDLEGTILKGRRHRQAIARAGGSVVTWAMAKANYMTVTIRSYADYLHSRFPKTDVELVPHGTFDIQPRSWVPQSARPPRIATMGKFGTYKRLETLLSAFDALRKNSRFADVELWIGGTDHPNTPGYLRGLAAHRSGDAGIRFLGYLPEEDIPDFFENARISVFDYESTTGSSGVLHQTASYGAVPIFPALGDFIEVSQDEGLIGRNFAPGDAAGLADAIGAVLDDPAGSELAARSNRQAALGFPMSKVARFHVERLATHCRVQRKAAAVPAADGAF